MNRDEARQEIKMRWREIIPTMTEPARSRVNGETSWICPVCGHGAHGDGLTFNRASRDGTGLKCFGGGCDFGSGDIIDLYQRTTGADYNTALSSLAAELGIAIDPPQGRTTPQEDFRDAAETPQQAAGAAAEEKTGERALTGEKSAERPQRAAEGQQADYTAYYRECAGRLEGAADYLTGRGISLETARRYGLGYDPISDPANNPGGTGTTLHPLSRVIIPVTNGHYIARSIVPYTPPQYQKMNPKGAEIGLFNVSSLYRQDAGAVYIVEGAFDALSVLEAGRQAVALNSANNTEKLLQALKERRTGALLIICLDNDSAGSRAAVSLAEGLTALKTPFGTADISGSYKDPNEFLQADRAGFMAALDRTERDILRPDNAASYLTDGFGADIKRFKEGGKPTGFKHWDKITTGLHAGLFMVAATPGAGKTTLVYQIAETMAAAGEDVLFFSLEQTRFDLLSKSIARRIKAADMDTKTTNAVIRAGSAAAAGAVSKARETFLREVGNRLSIIPGNFSLSAKDIEDYTERYILRTGKKPVVIVDYLQALRPISDKKGVREAIDETTDCLCGLKNRHDLIMIVISSVSRANYYTPLDMDALKESGRLEYSADAVWLLELACMSDELFESDKEWMRKKGVIAIAKAATPRKVVLKCAKSRFSPIGGKSNLNYYAGNDLFIEEAEDDFTPISKGDNIPFERC